MQINVTARHVDITEALRNYATERIEHELADFDRIENVHVILDVEKYRQSAEIVVQAKGHVRVEAKTESDDMYASIEQTVEKAERQLRRLRDKIQDHKGRERLAQVDMEHRPESGE